MKKDLLIILILVILSVIVFRKSFFVFFAQDDFVMIMQFSHNKVLTDLLNVFGPPQISHWRPIDNLYYFIAGNIFNKNYFAYHILTFLLHISSAFFIYKIALRFINNKFASISAGIIYAIHPAFFISFFWISGGATVIGFFFFILSFYLHLLGKQKISIIAYFLSLLASEAMVAGVFIFIFYRYLYKSKGKNDVQWLIYLAITALFLIFRYLFLTPKTSAETYSIEFNYKIFSSVKFYLLQILSYTNISHGLLFSSAIFVWIVLLAIFLIRSKNYFKFIFFLSILFSGLLPFILLPNHLSSHYMNISIFGFCLLVALAVNSLKTKAVIYFVSIFILLSFISVDKTYNNNWVISRSKISKQYIESIEKSNLPSDSTIVFNDNVISSSYEAYVSLGTGKAIDFWFAQKNYKTCFVEFEICETKP